MYSVGERIKYLRKKHHLTQEALGKKVGVTSVTVSKWELDTAKPKSQSMIKLCKFFKVDIEWLTFGRESKINLGISKLDEREEVVKVPFFEEVEASAGHGCEISLENADYEFLIPQRFLKQQSQKLVSLKVNGDSMEPEFKDGSIICIDLNKQKIIDGRSYVVNHNGMLRLKQLEKIPDSVIMKSYNVMYNDVKVTSDDAFCVVGEVVLQLKFYD
jgi:phage repressor protein C with HTH and peptisase S24 domain